VSWWTGYGAGMRKDAARLDEWAKDVASSTELRTWYRHDPAKFGEFRRRYAAELGEPGPREALSRIRSLAADGPVTLLTATKAVDLSQAAVLAALLRGTAQPGNGRLPGGAAAGWRPPGTRAPSQGQRTGTGRTVAEARAPRWLMEVPTCSSRSRPPGGLQAITAWLAEGISINVTLIFSLARYGEMISHRALDVTRPGGRKDERRHSERHPRDR